MRKIVLLFCSVTVFSFFASAQITKGSTLIGGGINLGRTKQEPIIDSDYTKQVNSSINLSAGVAIKENLVAGGSLSYGHVNYQVINSLNTTLSSNKGNSYGAGAFLRRYVPLGKNFYLFGQAGLNFGISKGEQTSNVNARSESTGWNVSLSAAPGISYALTKKFQLELGFNELASLYYGQSNSETTGNGPTVKGKNSSYGLSTSLGTSTPLNLGFRLLFIK